MSAADTLTRALVRVLERLDRTPVELAVGVVATALLAVNAFWFAVPGAALAALALAFTVPGGGIFAIALSLPMLPPMRLGGPIFDMRPDEVLAMGVIIGYGLRLLAGSARPRTRVWRWAVVLVCIMAVSLAIRYGIRWEIPQLRAFYPTAKWAVRLALLGSVVWMGWRSPDRGRALRVAVMLGGLAAAVMSIGQYFIPAVNEFIRDTYPASKGEVARVFYYGRSFGAFEGNPNHLAAAMLLLSIVALSWAEKTRSVWVKGACVLSAFAYLAAMVHTGSRGALIVLVILMVGYAYRRRWFLVSGSGFAILYTLAVPNALRARLPMLLSFKNGAIEFGTSATGKLAMLDPGYAAAHGTIVTPVDSTYLDLLYNYGPVALVAFLCFVFVVAAYVTRGSRHDDPRGSATAAVWVLGATALLGLQGPFFSVSRVGELCWLVVGLGIATTVRARAERLDRTRIAVCTSVHSAGDARIVHREARALAARLDVHLYTFARAGDSPAEDSAGVPRTHLSGAPRNRFARALRAGTLVQRALADGAGTIIVHDPEMLPWLVALASEPDVVTAYDMHEDYVSMVRTKPWIAEWLRPLVGALLAMGERVLLPRLDLLVVADDYLASRYAARNPVAVRNYPPAALFDADMGAVVPAGTRPPVILYVGGVTRERGAETMISALAVVRERVPSAELVVIGRVPHGDAGDRLRSTPGVTVVGEVAYDAIAERVVAARVGLALLEDSPKYRRNVPSKLFDYMACGTPFVASDLPNIREATRGVGGLFVDPGDVAAVAGAIISLITDDELASRLGAEGLGAARERFSFEGEGERLVGRIRELLEEKSR